MNIAIVTQSYGPTNGPGAFVASLARGLADAGDAVTVITPAASRRSSIEHDGPVAIAAVRACSLAPLWPEVRVAIAPARPLRRLLAELAPDVVHLQDHYPLCAAACRACAAPMIATNHFVPENIAPHVPLLPRRFVERVLWRSVARVFARSAIVTAPTETAAARIAPALGREVRVVSCGVDRARFERRVDRATARESLGLRGDDRVFVYVGRLDVEKRVEVLVRALAHVQRRDAKLLVVGRGQRARALRVLARTLGVDDRVVFTGFATPGRVAELLAAADVFAMPGDVELQSIATLEAMASGLPVLAARAGALPELVDDGENGALFHPNDALSAAGRMRELLAVRERWPAMGRESRTRAARHDARFTVAAYRALYADVARQGCTSRS